MNVILHSEVIGSCGQEYWPQIRQMARLLVASITKRSQINYVPREEDVDGFIDLRRSYEGYMLVDGSGQLLAGATVLHGCEAEHTEDKVTAIMMLATDPDQRKRGYAKELVREIARVGLERGDTLLEVNPIDEATDYWLRLGFQEPIPPLSSKALYATAEQFARTVEELESDQ